MTEFKFICFCIIFTITFFVLLTRNERKKGILADKDIRYYCDFNNLIEPFEENYLQPASYDLKLKDVDNWILMPGEFVLGVTEEKVNIPANILGRLDGKSTLARDGILVHCTSGFIDPGFYGNIVLEIKNISDRVVDLTQYETVAQISFEELKSLPEKIYGECNNHYQGQQGIVKSWIKEKENK